MTGQPSGRTSASARRRKAPEILFDGGTNGWPIPCTEADLAKLECRIAERRQAQAAGLLEGRDDDPQAQ